jgi:hypothetical protein
MAAVISYGCETSRHSDFGMSGNRRWVRSRSPAHPRAHCGTHRQLLDVLGRHAIRCPCGISDLYRAAGSFTRQRSASTRSTIRLGQNASGGGANIQCRKHSIPSFPHSNLCEAVGIFQPGASRGRECHDHRYLYRLRFFDFFGNFEGFSPTSN